VNPAASRAALAALDVVRPAIARLAQSSETEDLSALVAQAWSAIEGALRLLTGDTAAAGTELLREARQRQFLTFDQANVLAAFHAAYVRTRDGGSAAGQADARLARDAFHGMEAALSSPAVPPASPTPASPPIAPPGMRASPLSGPTVVPPPGHSNGRLARLLVALLIVLVALFIATRWYAGRRDRAVAHAIELYDRGAREAAQADFEKAVQIDGAYALPHVYLARIARETRDLPRAQRESQLAVQADPRSALALREMGAYLLTAGNYELARKFYLRALDVNVEDHVAQGYLACALFKLGRTDEGLRWVTRAGQGSWSSCVPSQGRGIPTPP
jgi:tetratricopeptide (TPR) repeat protein